MRQLRVPAVSGLLAASLLLGACSTNRFKEPVNDFGAAVGATQDLSREYENRMQKQAVANGVDDALRLRHGLELDPAQCHLGTDPAQCAIRDTVTRKPLLEDVPIAEPAKLAALLRVYAAALQGLVNADTSGDLDQSTDKLGGAVSGLADKLGRKAQLDPSIDVFTAGFKFLVGNYLEYRRLQVLRSATKQADPLIGEASGKLADLVGGDQRMLLSVQAATTQNTVARANLMHCPCGPVEESAKRAALGDALAQTSRLRGLMKTDAAAAIRRMGAAHHQLAQAVNDPDASHQLDLDALRDFARQAKDVYDAIGKL